MLPGSPSQNFRCVQQQFNTEERLCKMMYTIGVQWQVQRYRWVAWTGSSNSFDIIYLPVASQGVSYDPFAEAEQTRVWLMDESVCYHQTVDGCRLKPHSGGILKHSEDKSSSLAEHLSVTCQNLKLSMSSGPEVWIYTNPRAVADGLAGWSVN